MIVPKFSEVFVGKKYFSTLTQETDLSVMTEELTIKYNNVIIVNDGQPRPKQLEKALLKPINKVAIIKRLTKYVDTGKISTNDYFKYLLTLLHEN